jgi:hypothetical protein
MPQARHIAANLHAWKAKFGGMSVSDAKRLRQLEEENEAAGRGDSGVAHPETLADRTSHSARADPRNAGAG